MTSIQGSRISTETTSALRCCTIERFSRVTLGFYSGFENLCISTHRRALMRLMPLLLASSRALYERAWR